MSWDPDAETWPAPLREAGVSPVALAVALAVPVLLLARLFVIFA